MRLPTPRVSAVAVLLLLAACGAQPQPVSPQPSQGLSARTLSARAPRSTVVLVHGLGGFSELGEIDYFYGIPGMLSRMGVNYLIPATSAFASIEVRAAQLKTQLDQIPGPLLLVAHSQGGLDARYLITRLGYASRVRALVTIGTPHHGTPVADLVFGLVPGPVVAATDALLSVLGWSLDGAAELTTSYMDQTFNGEVPDTPGVTYWSYSGEATPFALGWGNGWLHLALAATWGFLDSNGIPSDGIVPEESAHWGQFQGRLRSDHLGEVNQPLGFVPDFDARYFYASLMSRLHDQGF